MHPISVSAPSTPSGLLRRLFFAAMFAFAPAVVADSPAEKIALLLPDVPHSPQHSRPFLFARAQFKFSLEYDDYLNRYVDRPLYLDPSMTEGSTKLRQAAKEALLYGLDGLAFFPQNGAAARTYDYAKEVNIPEFRLLTEFYPKDGGANPLSEALASPQALTWDGKLVISSYNASRKPAIFWKQYFDEARKTHGDKFIFLPELTNFGDIPISNWIKMYHEGTITSAQIEAAKEYLREWARATDGLYFASTTIVRDNDRNFDAEFYRNFIIRIMKSVLAEPEFKGKHLGLGAKLGHENHTRIGRTLNSNGTKTLRHSLEAALDAQPDLINIPEWDEFNESTSLMPTIYDGRSSMRIIRYYASKARETKLKPLAGDDLSIPDLIISYRKLLAMGEKLEIELLNVPDPSGSTEEAENFTASVFLEDLSGKVIYQSEEFTFKRGEIRDHTIAIPSESIASHRILRPRVQIISAGERHLWDHGLHYIEIRPTWNWDYKWVKQPLRDLLKPEKARFEIREEDGQLFAEAQLQAGEELTHVEILENDNVVYSHSESNSNWRDNESQIVLSIGWKSPHSFGKPLELDGDITLEGTPARWLFPVRTDINGIDRRLVAQQTLSLKKQRSSIWQRRMLLAISRADADKATLRFSIPGIYDGTIPVREILENSIYGIAGPEGFNMVVSHFVRQNSLPKNLQSRQVKFAATITPEMEGSVFHLQAIGKSGRLYRSQPLVYGKGPTGKTNSVTVWSDSAKDALTLEIDTSLIPDLTYEFTPRNGSILKTKAGRPFWGILGGYSTLVTERGASPGDGAPFLAGEHPAFATKSAPTWEKIESEEFALRFDGKGTYLTLPQGAIPRRAGYTISMEIKPETLEGQQTLIANRASRFGTLSVYLDSGTLKASFIHDLKSWEMKNTEGIDSGLKLQPDQWSKVRITYNQKELIFDVNGETRKVQLEGPGMHDTVSVVGGFDKAFFNGLIKSLRIQHTANSKN